MPVKDKERIVAFVQPEVMARVKEEAKSFGLSMSAYINLLIRQHFEATDNIKAFGNISQLLDKLEDLRTSVDEAKEVSR